MNLKAINLLYFNNKIPFIKISDEIEERLLRIIDAYLKDNNKNIKIEHMRSHHTSAVFRVSHRSKNKYNNFYIKMGFETSNELKEYIYNEYKNTLKAFNIFENKKYMGATKPIDSFYDEAAFIAEELPGTRMDYALRKTLKFVKGDNGIEIANNWCRSCADWILTFQEKFPHEVDYLTVADMENKIDWQLKKLECLDYNLNSDLIKKLKYITNEILMGFDKKDFLKKPKHNDFAPWNIIVCGSSINVLDFADIQDDSMHYDIFYFTDSLKFLKRKNFIKDSSIAYLQKNMLQHYSPGLTKEHKSYLYFKILFLLIRMNAILIKSKYKQIVNAIVKNDLKKCYFELDEIVNQL